MTERGRRPADRTERARVARVETQEQSAPADTRELLRRTEEMRARRQRPTRGGRPARRRRARLPAAAWVCFGVALLNGIAWGLITPLFQVPDEPGHVAYAQYIAESGKVPTGSINIKSHFSQEESRLVDAMRWREVHRRKDIRVPGTWSAHQRLERAVDTPAGRLSEGGYTTDTNNPPLYYAAAAAVYHLSPSTALPDRVHVMRLLSALLAAVTVLFVFLFLRELLPSTPWAWPVGALAVAFQPMFAFTASGVTSDTVLYAASAGIFFLFARAFRRDLTPRLGAAIGALAVVGVLAKINMLGLAPGIAIGLLVLVIRASRDRRREALGGALAAIAVVAVPMAIYMLLNSTVWERGLYFGAFGVQGPTGIPVPGGVETKSAELGGAISYMWQFYLPRLPPMEPIFDTYQLRQTWFNGFIGQFGWLDYGFANWVYNLALVIALGLVALVAKELIAVRNVIRSRLGELLTYLALVAGLLLLIGGTSYIARIGGAPGYEQPRYLFPLLALYGALVALAARGAGRRYGPAVGVLLVSIAIAHTAAAMLLTLTRFHG
jgi:Predicted membrane protein (DUF2142)